MTTEHGARIGDTDGRVRTFYDDGREILPSPQTEASSRAETCKGMWRLTDDGG